MREFFTVQSSDEGYNSPLIGNGEIVTTIGPTGYHNGFCPPDERVNRTIFWAGRRLQDARNANIRIPRVPPEELIGPTRPLIRFGTLARTLSINGIETTDEEWVQVMDPDEAQVISTLHHGSIQEQTTSVVCLTTNLLVFHTSLRNHGEEASKILFMLDYEFGDAEGIRSPDTRLHIRRPYPDDLMFGNVEGIRAREIDLDQRPPHLEESLSVQYDVNDQLGEVHIGRHPLGIIMETEFGGKFTHEIELKPGESSDLWFWVAIGDRRKYMHFPNFTQMTELLSGHKKAWKEFWRTSQVSFGNPQLESLLKSCLYTIRCNASPWYVPPGYLSTHWEGRTFHDDFYPFMALISGNYWALADRMPNHRLLVLPHAMERGYGRGANYAWEFTETGEESAPYGHWTDEQFRQGQFAEACWRYYLYTGSLEALDRYYPVIRGCAEWLIHDVLVRDEDGQLKTRLITDINESVYPVFNCISLSCATIRTLQNAARAAELLQKDSTLRVMWQTLASELRQSLPVDETGERYRYAEDKDAVLGSSHLPMVYPFSFDVHGKRAQKTLELVCEAYHARRGAEEDVMVLADNWLWALSRMATMCFYQGRATDGYLFLTYALDVIGPFMAPNEHYRKDEGPFLPWFTTGAGAFVHAIYAMFVRVVDDSGATLLFGLPKEVQECDFEGLLAANGVTISGQIRSGKLVSLSAHSKHAMDWQFRIPTHIQEGLEFTPIVAVGETEEHNLVTMRCSLVAGINDLVKR